jgi:hypothetical protein
MYKNITVFSRFRLTIFSLYPYGKLTRFRQTPLRVYFISYETQTLPAKPEQEIYLQANTTMLSDVGRDQPDLNKYSYLFNINQLQNVVPYFIWLTG